MTGSSGWARNAWGNSDQVASRGLFNDLAAIAGSLAASGDNSPAKFLPVGQLQTQTTLKDSQIPLLSQLSVTFFASFDMDSEMSGRYPLVDVSTVISIDLFRVGQVMPLPTSIYD